MGHVYVICLILLIQSLVYREISVLFRSTNDPWSNTLNWYFFAVANYFLYGETIIYYFKVGQKFLVSIPCPFFLGSMSCSRMPCSCHLQRITDSSALCSTCSVGSSDGGVLFYHSRTFRFYGLRRLPQEKLPSASILALRMGAYDTPRCRT